MRLTVESIARATRGTLVKGTPNADVDRFSTDSRTLAAGDFFIPLRGDRFDGHDFLAKAHESGAAGALVDRDVPDDAVARLPILIRVADTTEALGLLASHVRDQVSVPVVGITGSNGKTSTKELTAAALGPDVLKPQASFNNHVGVSRTLLSLTHEHKAVVLEMGTNHQGEIAALVHLARPTIGVLLNVAPVHTEYLGDETAILEEKSALPLGAAHAVLNADDPRVISLAERCRQVTTFGVHSEATVVAAEIAMDPAARAQFDLMVQGSRVARVRLRLLGRHQVMNALAAITAGIAVGIDPQQMVSRLVDVAPLDMRLRPIDVAGVTFYNDAYNANPASVVEAFRTLRMIVARGRRYVVVGEMRELGDGAVDRHREVVRYLSPDWCEVFLPVGRFADAMAAVADVRGIRTVVPCASLDEAAAYLAQTATSGDIVLLKASRAVGLERLVDLFAASRDSNDKPHS